MLHFHLRPPVPPVVLGFNHEASSADESPNDVPQHFSTIAQCIHTVHETDSNAANKLANRQNPHLDTVRYIGFDLSRFQQFHGNGEHRVHQRMKFNGIATI